MRFSVLWFAIALFTTGCHFMPSYAQTSPFPSDLPVAKPRYRYTEMDPLYRAERQYLDSLRPAWNLVSVHLTQLLVREVQVSYERFVSRRLSIEAAGGIRIPNFDNSEVYNGMFSQDYDINYKAYPFIRSYYSALGVKWSLVTFNERPQVPVYLTVVPFYRYNFFDDQVFSAPALSSFDNAAYWQSKHQHISGVKAGLGFRLPAWPLTKPTSFSLTFLREPATDAFSPVLPLMAGRTGLPIRPTLFLIPNL